MNISSISSQTGSSYSVNSNNDPIKLLLKQKETLQELIQKTKEGKMDEKAKQEKVKQLQDQIQEIDAEIQQRQAEKLNKSKERTGEDASKQPEAQEVSGNSGAVFSMSGMTDLIEAGSAYSNIQKISSLKKNFHNTGAILKKEIEIDESRGVSGTASTAKRKELQKIESTERTLNKNASDMLRKVQDHIENSKQAEDKQDISDEETADNNINSESVSAAAENNNDSSQAYKKIDVKI